MIAPARPACYAGGMTSSSVATLPKFPAPAMVSPPSPRLLAGRGHLRGAIDG